MAFQAAGRTDVGLVRKENQDNYLMLTQQGVFAVADGMGGHAGGGEASRITVDSLERALGHVGVVGEADVEQALREADALIMDEAEKNRWEGMGTTLVLAFRDDNIWKVAHIGDSRAYVIGGGRMYPLTKDHSLVEELLARGTITPEEAKVHPHRHVLTRALGTNGDTKPEWNQVGGPEADYLLLCTDGLYNMVDDDTMLGLVLADGLSLEEKVDRLVDEAKRCGGADNITAILIGEDGR